MLASCSSGAFPAPGPLLGLFPLLRTLSSFVFTQDDVLSFQAHLWDTGKNHVPFFQSSPLVSNCLCLLVYPLLVESVHESKDRFPECRMPSSWLLSWFSANIYWISEWVIKILSPEHTYYVWHWNLRKEIASLAHQGNSPLNQQSRQSSPIKTFHHRKETYLCVCECGFQSKYETPSKVIIGGSYEKKSSFPLNNLKWRQITDSVQNVWIKFISPCWHGTRDTHCWKVKDFFFFPAVISDMDG